MSNFYLLRSICTVIISCTCWYLSAQPVITGIQPRKGAVGSTVEITGSNFSFTLVNNHVHFGPVKGEVISSTATRLLVKVPAGAGIDPIRVTSNQLTTTATAGFQVTVAEPPAIASTLYSRKQEINSAGFINTVVLEDLNEDGKADLITNKESAIWIYRNSTTSNDDIKLARNEIPVILNAANQSADFITNDVNGDGKKDIIMLHKNAALISVYRNTSNSSTVSFSGPTDISLAYSAGSIAMEDIDGDGRPDMVLGYRNNNRLTIKKNNSTLNSISFTGTTDITTPEAVGSLTLQDLNADGKPDIVAATYNAVSGALYIYQNAGINGAIGNTSFSGRITIPLNNTSPSDIIVADLNDDLKPEITVALSDRITIFQNLFTSGNVSVGSFGTGIELETGKEYRKICIADINSDGKPDIAGGLIAGGINILQNNSNGGNITAGTFTVGITLSQSAGSAPASMVVGDLDGDSKPEIIASKSSSEQIMVLVYVPQPVSNPIAVSANTVQSVCSGTNRISVPYQVQAGTPTKYSVVWNTEAIAAGLSNQLNAALSNNLVSINLLAGLPLGVYNGVIAYSDASGNTSNQYAVAITIKQTPEVAPIEGPASVCIGPSQAKYTNATPGGTWRSVFTQIATISNANDNTKGTLTGIATGNTTIGYRVVNDQNCANEVFKVVSVQTASANPAIVGQPADSIITEGGSAAFTVTTDNTSAYAYQWQVSADSGATWNNISAAGSDPVYAGFTTHILTLNSIGNKSNEYQYRCRVTNTAGCNTNSLFSRAATLLVVPCASPVINNQPQSMDIAPGQKAVFAVGPENNPDEYTFQWQVSTNNGNSWNNITVAGTAPQYNGWNTPVLTLTNTSLNQHQWMYRSVVTNKTACAGLWTVSNQVTLTVTPVCEAPTLTEQPNSVIVTKGSAATFIVGTDGNKNDYTYQWQISKDLGKNWVTIDSTQTSPMHKGWNTETLLVSGIYNIHNNYLYRAIVTAKGNCSNFSTTSSNAGITVTVRCIAPEIKTNPVDQYLNGTTTTRFSVTAKDGTTPYTYQWQVSTNNGVTWSTITAAGSSPVYSNWNSSELQLSGITAANNGYTYRALVFSAAPCSNSVVISQRATLNVENICSAPEIVLEPVNQYIVAPDKASFSIIAKGGIPPYRYQWQKSDNYGTSWTNITEQGNWPSYKGYQSDVLTISNTVSSTGMVNPNQLYRCIVISAGNCNDADTSKPASLFATVGCEAINTRTYLNGNNKTITVTNGTSLSLEIESSIQQPFFTYQWYISKNNGISWDSVNQPGTVPKYSNFNTPKLTISNISSDVNGYVLICEIRGNRNCGSNAVLSERFTLLASPQCSSPVIIEEPLPRNFVKNGNNMVISVKASGGLAPYTYRWQVWKGTDWEFINERSDWEYQFGEMKPARYTFINYNTPNLTITNPDFCPDQLFRCLVYSGGKCSGNYIASSFSYLLGTKNRPTFQLKLSQNIPEAGTISGGGTYFKDENAILSAIPAKGWRFDKWEIYNPTTRQTFTDYSPEYTLLMYQDFSAVAIFVKENPVQKYLEIGNFRIYGNNISDTGITRRILGNCKITLKENCIDNTNNPILHFSGGISVNTATNTLTTFGSVYCTNVGKWGNINIINGLLQFTLDSNALVLKHKTEVYYLPFRLADFGIETDDIKILPNCKGVVVTGKITLPEILVAKTPGFPKVQPKIEGIYLTADGLDLISEISIKDVDFGKYFNISELSLKYDGIENELEGKIDLKFPAFQLGAGATLKDQQLTKVEVGFSDAKTPVPFFATGLGIEAAKGGLDNLNKSTDSMILNLSAKLVPLYSGVGVLSDIQTDFTYEFGNRAKGNASLSILKEPFANAGFEISKNQFSVYGGINIKNVITGDAAISINLKDELKVNGEFETTLQTPELEEPLEIFSNQLIGRGNTVVSNNYIAGSATAQIFGLKKNIFYYYPFDSTNFIWGTNLNKLPAEARKDLKLDTRKPLNAFSYLNAIKSNYTPTQKVSLSGGQLIRSFEIGDDAGSIFIYGKGNEAPPSLNVYLGNKDTLTENNATRYRNVVYYKNQQKKSTTIILDNLPKGKYITWSDNVDSIRILKEIPDPRIEILNVTRQQSRHELEISYRCHSITDSTMISFGIDTDRSNADGTVLVSNIKALSGIQTLTIPYDSIKTDNYYVYGIIAHSNGQQSTAYYHTRFPLSPRNAPQKPLNVKVFQQEGVAYIGFEKNNHTPLGYIVYYAPQSDSVTYRSSYRFIGDTSFAEFNNIPKGRTYTFRVTATDSLGNESEMSDTAVLAYTSDKVNNYPVFHQKIYRAKAATDSLFEIRISATDPDNDNLVYEVVNKPQGLTITNEGRLLWVPRSADIGTKNLWIKTTDQKGGIDSVLLSILVFNNDMAIPLIQFNKNGFNNISEQTLISVQDELITEQDNTDSIAIQVYASSNKKGIQLKAARMGNATSFGTLLSFSETANTNNTLQVVKGDTIFASYTSTLSGKTVTDHMYYRYVRADMVSQDSLCHTDTVKFYSSSKGSALQYRWDFGDGSISTEENPAHRFPAERGSGAKRYMVKLQVTNAQGDTSGTTKMITVFNSPEKKITALSRTTFCMGDSVKLKAPPAQQFLWSTGSTDSVITIKKAGKYIVLSSNGNACFELDTVNIMVNNLPVVEAGTPVTADLGKPVQLGGKPTALGNGPFKYIWSPAVGMNNSIVANPTIIPFKNNIYSVTVTDANGCTATDKVLVKVTPAIVEDEIFVYPNPARQTAQIRFILTADITTRLLLYDQQGRIIKTIVNNEMLKKGYHTYQVNLGHLHAGTYYISLNGKKISRLFKQ